jgi:ribosomal subunit interface protein
MDIVLNSRQCELNQRFRDHVEEKLARLEKHDHGVIRVEVEVTKERNPRQADRAVVVQLTAFSRGPVIRSEAAAEDKHAALDQALDRIAAQMRRAADRKRVHRGRHTPVSVARALAGVEAGSVDVPLGEEPPASTAGPIAVDGEGPLVVRTKTHAASPMTLDQALYEMELVGHDFFLFIDKESERPSVVYRRRGYDYGVISLDVS